MKLIKIAMIGSIRIARIKPNILTVFKFSLAINNTALVIEMKKIKPEMINIQSNGSILNSPEKLNQILKYANVPSFLNI